ncbi:UNVERIFIED_CONTAM: hypothetical protein Slati_2673600 [Sesamum latifolium]|uniref:DUF4283 domain-containing protein n=1 Tax=Sesamum latifolium TaxID=2727402 RepID=A0AAW2VVS8_9LAMI
MWFFVHVHDIPLSMMNLGVARLIGDRLGGFRDMDADESGCSWGASLRIRVSIDVTKPLKRVLKLKSPSGNELLTNYAKFDYEDGFQDPANSTPYGPWLRAPVPGRGHISMPQVGRPSPTSGASQVRPPLRTGVAVFGSFKGKVGDVGRGDHGVNNCHCLAGTQGTGHGIEGEEVESSPVGGLADRERVETIEGVEEQ